MAALDLIVADGQWERATCRLQPVEGLLNNYPVWRAEEPIAGEDVLYVWIYRDPRMVWQVTAGPATELGAPWPENVAKGRGFMAGSFAGADSPTDERNLPWEEYSPTKRRFEPFPADFVACLAVQEAPSAPPTPRRGASFDKDTFASFGGPLMRSGSSLVDEMEPSVLSAARDAATGGVLQGFLPAFEVRGSRPPASFSSYRVLAELVPTCEAYAAGLGLSPHSGGGGGSEEEEKSERKGGSPTSVLHWCPEGGLPSFGDLTHLVPLPTDGDGNCLLHALSLGMWGMHAARPSSARPTNALTPPPAETPAADHDVEPLRGLLDRMLRNDEFASCAEPKWHAEQQRQNDNLGAAKISKGPELQRAMFSEWQRAVDEAGRPGVFLGKLHVYALSQVLKRPIVVFQDNAGGGGGGGTGGADAGSLENGVRALGLEGGGGDGLGGGDFGEDMAGVYLPTLWGVYRRQHECCREPLVVLFNGRDHFTALVFPEGPVNPAAAVASADCLGAVTAGEVSQRESVYNYSGVASMVDDVYGNDAASTPGASVAPTRNSPPAAAETIHLCRCVPLNRANEDRTPLPLRFSDPGDSEQGRREELLHEYLDVVEPWKRAGSNSKLREPVLCAASRAKYLLPESSVLRDAHRIALLRAQRRQEHQLQQNQGGEVVSGLVEGSSDEADLQEAIKRSTAEMR